MKQILLSITALAVASAFLLIIPAAAADVKVVTIGADQFVEVERWTLGGEIIVRLRQKATSDKAGGTVPSAAPSPAPSTGIVKTEKADKPDAPKSDSIWANLAPEQAKTFYDTLAKEDANNITDSPGLNALGINVSDINHPTTPKDFGVALAKGTDRSGNVKEGVALQFTPATLFFPSTIIGGVTYRDNPWMQAWARTSMELASAKSDIKASGHQTAASITIGLMDKADPRLFWTDYERCAREQMAQLPPPPGPLATADEITKYTEIADKLLQQANVCANKITRHWAQNRLYAGVAKGWNTGAESTKIQDLKSGPSMVWTTYAFGLETGGAKGAVASQDAPPIVRKQFELALSKKWNLPIADADDQNKFHKEYRTDAIARIRFSRDRWNAFVDAGLSRVRTDGVLSANVRRFGYGAEYKVDDNLWLVMGSVVEHGYVGSESKRTLLNMGLRFGQTNKEVFQAPGYDAAAPGAGKAVDTKVTPK